MDFNYKINEIDEITKGLDIVISNENFSSKYEEILKHTISNIKINGFRPGKAPRNMVESMYKASIVADTKERLVREAIESSIKKENLKVYNVLKVDFKNEDKKDSNDNGFSFTASVELFPTLPEVPAYEGLKVEAEEDKVTDEKIEKAINDFLARFKAPKEILENRPATKEDEKKVTIVATYKNKDGKEWSHEYNDIYLISNSIDSALPEAVIGMKKGETKEVVSKDEATKDGVKYLAGEGTFKLTLNGIYEMVLPELTDDFVKNLPNFGLESVQEFKDRMKDALEMETSKANEERVRMAIVNKLLESYDFAIPASMVDREIKNMMMQTSGYQINYDALTDEMANRMREIYSDEAKRRIKVASLIDAIAYKEKVSVSSSDVEAYLASVAYNTNSKIEDLRKEIKQNKLEDGVKLEIARSKTWNLLSEKADVTKVALKEGEDSEKEVKKTTKKASKATKKETASEEKVDATQEAEEKPKRGRKKKEETK